MRKFLALLLACLTLASLFACGQPEGDRETGTGARSENGSSVEDDTEDTAYVLDLSPGLSYRDEPVHILYAKANGRDDELQPSDDGGVVSSAVHDRNVLVEDRLKVKLDLLPDKDGVSVAPMVSTDIKSGSGEYDVIVNGTFLSVAPAMTGQYRDLNALENINTSKRYWTQGYNDMVTFTEDRMQFLASGPIAISMFRLMYFTIYNRKLFQDNGIPDLYETVLNGDWTLDYQYGIATNRYDDADGDNKRSKGDAYGFVTGNTISVDAYPVASDIHLVVKDEETGDLKFNKGALKALSNMAEKVQLLYNDESTYVFSGQAMDDVPLNNIAETFTIGKTLMATFQFLKMETNFKYLAPMSYGIAPMPKFSKEQDGYRSYVQDQVSSFGVSAGVKSEDRCNMCAAVLETMAYESNLLIRPTYYDTVLSLRYMQDPESKAILDLLFDSVYFDFSQTCSNMFTSCIIRDKLRPLVSGKVNRISSATRSWERSVNRTLDQYNQDFAKRYGTP